mmetsp:Transcript_45493/g.51645  ORF Transcript_45493/g.51645 Transcript_45493/m.51645 type:complete len:224 (-) Transcript_45493:32-703(-)|eukprot:CAMPEP_0170816944 /NCGR_PEP_ID=MMETSP0733-20121128/39679_1 /TAXON_ID=186038 /ORGANISM="Fragilariopsis kerguelensis, Strain L26-C5" /LENGTH=223 /DNA_ID=CAMNT_0011176437 /DNA_START=83 /DNA_END=754 /DNA_ORIENTATION=-
MKISTYLSLALMGTTHASDSAQIRRTKQYKSSKTKAPKNPPVVSEAACDREVWSIVNPNTGWTGHTHHPQVWYHNLEDIHSLWKDGYFDYVLDIRPLEDITIDNEGSPLLLQGYETFHIPGSYPITVFPPTTPADEVDMLVDFTSTNVCKDSRVFVHCWSGISGNMVAQTLIELGFTNVHAAGPEGNAGIWDWKTAGYELVENDKFDANEKRFQPSCMDACTA